MAHFVSGAIWVMVINRKVDPETAREQWIKYLVYLFLFNMLWHSVVWTGFLFPVLGYVIIGGCLVELWRTAGRGTPATWLIFAFVVIMAGFWRFLYLEQTKILLTYFVVVLFDGSSQIAGQWKGRRALVPKISPGKTVEGLVGGALVTLGTTLLVHRAFSYDLLNLIWTTCLIMMAAFAGDLMASALKRKRGLLRFSNAIPGHGGFLDRYDSLVISGGVMFLISLTGQ